ncbi:hypothetical protein [Fusobacterium sp.]|uniref:hypothetical protein n=1 Tax=Fusobacterium sp. TaxID=68766 RepID=UPI0025C3A9A1|nr:hypothetical protein [Fusobacterium sp.]MCI5725502.1 hypothetical protein [Fusobacterium sp.]
MKVQHKDGDNTAINMVYAFSTFLKDHKTLWDTPNNEIYLNRFYKGLLTKTIKKCDIFLDRYRSKINIGVLEDVAEVVSFEFEKLKYKDIGINRELLKSMFCAILLFDSVRQHKKLVIGVTLKMFLRDIEKAFEQFYEMWTRDIDENILKILNGEEI